MQFKHDLSSIQNCTMNVSILKSKKQSEDWVKQRNAVQVPDVNRNLNHKKLSLKSPNDSTVLTAFTSLFGSELNSFFIEHYRKLTINEPSLHLNNFIAKSLSRLKFIHFQVFLTQ